jgi:hypothetical protein
MSSSILAWGAADWERIRGYGPELWEGAQLVVVYRIFYVMGY